MWSSIAASAYVNGATLWWIDENWKRKPCSYFMRTNHVLWFDFIIVYALRQSTRTSDGPSFGYDSVLIIQHYWSFCCEELVINCVGAILSTGENTNSLNSIQQRMSCKFWTSAYPRFITHIDEHFFARCAANAARCAPEEPRDLESLSHLQTSSKIKQATWQQWHQPHVLFGRENLIAQKALLFWNYISA